MSKSRSFLIGIGIIAALVIGFLIGISVDYPRLSKRSVSGTIGKVNNYRNSQISEADILLKNELVTDTTKLKMLKGYFNFYYVGALKMTADAELAVKEAKSVEAFQTRNISLIASMENYGRFLLQARSDLLMALVACNSVGETDPILLRNTLNQGRNVVAQINYRDRVVLDFVDALSSFIKSGKPVHYQGLEMTHDLLMANQVYTAMITKNKAVLKFLDRTSMFSKSQENLNVWDQQKMSTMIQQDLEKIAQYNDAQNLGRLEFKDAEKLKVSDSERLRSSDAEKLGHALISDAVKMGNALILDTEKLRCDVEKLGTMDAEKLGGYQLLATDAEKLGHLDLTWADSEKLSGHDN